jgi:hypothetical protein
MGKGGTAEDGCCCKGWISRHYNEHFFLSICCPRVTIQNKFRITPTVPYYARGGGKEMVLDITI